MILGDTAIRAAVLHGRLRINPFIDGYVRPNSYDVHLNEKLLIPKFIPPRVVEPGTDNSDIWREQDLPYVIHSDGIALGSTIEEFEFVDLTGRLEGVSSLGRIFLRIHVTAGFFDYGFRGRATIEIKNDSNFPIRLHAGMRIGQMAFEEVRGIVTQPYAGRYQGQMSPTPARQDIIRD